MTEKLESPHPEGDPSPFQRQCTAKSKQSGVRCRGAAMPGSSKCKMHGGTNPGGRVKHGRYSKVLKRWREDFERLLNDEGLLDTRHDLAMMDVTIEDLIARVQDGDSPDWRAQVRDAYDQLQAAIRSRKQDRVAKAMKALGTLVEGGASQDAMAREVISSVDRRAARAQKLVEIQTRREQKVTARDLGLVFVQFVDVLRDELGPAMLGRVMPRLTKVIESYAAPLLGSEEDARSREEYLAMRAQAQDAAAGDDDVPMDGDEG